MPHTVAYPNAVHTFAVHRRLCDLQRLYLCVVRPHRAQSDLHRRWVETALPRLCLFWPVWPYCTAHIADGTSTGAAPMELQPGLRRRYSHHPALLCDRRPAGPAKHCLSYPVRRVSLQLFVPVPAVPGRAGLQRLCRYKSRARPCLWL